MTPQHTTLPPEVLATLTALWRWRCGRISGLDLIDACDQAADTIQNLLPKEAMR